jgi:hypothetical protein
VEYQVFPTSVDVTHSLDVRHHVLIPQNGHTRNMETGIGRIRVEAQDFPGVTELAIEGAGMTQVVNIIVHTDFHFRIEEIWHMRDGVRVDLGNTMIRGRPYSGRGPANRLDVPWGGPYYMRYSIVPNEAQVRWSNAPSTSDHLVATHPNLPNLQTHIDQDTKTITFTPNRPFGAELILESEISGRVLELVIPVAFYHEHIDVEFRQVFNPSFPTPFSRVEDFHIYMADGERMTMELFVDENRFPNNGLRMQEVNFNRNIVQPTFFNSWRGFNHQNPSHLEITSALASRTFTVRVQNMGYRGLSDRPLGGGYAGMIDISFTYYRGVGLWNGNPNTPMQPGNNQRATYALIIDFWERR